MWSAALQPRLAKPQIANTLAVEACMRRRGASATPRDPAKSQVDGRTLEPAVLAHKLPWVSRARGGPDAPSFVHCAVRVRRTRPRARRPAADVPERTLL